MIFPGDQAGIHLAMPLDYVFGADAFVVPTRVVTPDMASTLARLEADGRAILWIEDGGRPPIVPGWRLSHAVRDGECALPGGR